MTGLLLAWLATSSHALITVCSSGCNETTIAGAVSVAQPGEVIELGDGSYVADVVISQNQTIRAVNPGMATLDPLGGTAFTINGAVDFTLEDVGMQSVNGALVAANNAATVTLSGIDTLDASPEGSLHLIAMYGGGTLDVSNSTFNGNIHCPDNGALLFLDGGATGTFDTVGIGGGSAFYGGAIYVQDADLTLTNVDVSGASSVIHGGAMYVDYSGSVTVKDSPRAICCLKIGTTLPALPSTLPNLTVINQVPLLR